MFRASSKATGDYEFEMEEHFTAYFCILIYTTTMKKFLVLGILFILPITVYIFFASGKDNFAKLPVLTPKITELTGFRTIDDTPVRFKDRITVLGFFGKELLENKGNAFNLAHKIYKKNRGFQDFQLVIVLPEGTQDASDELKLELNQIADTAQWKFVFGSSEAIQTVWSGHREIISDSQVPENWVQPKAT